MPIKIKVRAEWTAELSDDELIGKGSDWIFHACPFDGTKPHREIIAELAKQLYENSNEEGAFTYEITDATIPENVAGYWDGSRDECEVCGEWFDRTEVLWCPFRVACHVCISTTVGDPDCRKKGCEVSSHVATAATPSPASASS